MAVHKSFTRWFASEFLKTEHFKNSITLMLVATYCWMAGRGVEVDSQFALLVGMVLGFYFKNENK